MIRNVCRECSANHDQCNRSGCDGRRQVGWRGNPVHPALAEDWEAPELLAELLRLPHPREGK